jgi:hypothetical protein
MRSALRLEISAEYSETLETLERLIAFAREIERLGIDVIITGSLDVIVRATPPEEPEPEP